MNDRALCAYFLQFGVRLGVCPPEPPTPRVATGGDMNRVVPSGADSGQFVAALSPVALNEAQEQACREWAADDRLWTTQDTVAFNLRTFARVILKEVPATKAAIEAEARALTAAQVTP